MAKICLQIREKKKRIRKAPNEFITMEPLTKTCFLSQVAAKTAEAPPRHECASTCVVALDCSFVCAVNMSSAMSTEH